MKIAFFGKYLKGLKGAKDTWRSLGPGLVTGAADDDPAGIATYSQTGARFGFSLLWLSLYTFPLMSIVQEMCARIALVTRKGLAQNVKEHFPKKVLYVVIFLLAFANIVNIGANLAAMGAASRLILPQVPILFFVVLYALLILFLEIVLSYKTYAKYLKWLALSILSYVIVAFAIDIPWTEVVRSTLIPSFSLTKETLIIITAVLGTTISPYLFFWQSSQEVEDEEGHIHRSVPKKEIKRMRTDVWIGMLLSNVVMFCIITVAGSVLHKYGIFEIETADQAAQALRPVAGGFAYALFATGIIGTGLLAIPILAGSLSYALSETLGWSEGLSKKLAQARGFYGILILAVLMGVGMNVIGLRPIQSLIASAVLNGLIAPVMLYFILRISSNKKIMGVHKNGPVSKSIGWVLILVMSIVAIATIVSIF